MERRAGHGFAGQPFGNQGVQYGFDALDQGLITAAQSPTSTQRPAAATSTSSRPAARLAGDDGAVVNATAAA